MSEIIQEWLGTRLGIIVDLEPENFGRNTKDGELLAKILHSYGLITSKMKESVKPMKTINECYNNLLVVKPWLDSLGVPCEDSTLKEVANGQGTAALRLFYALYLILESKDLFYYLSVQKEGKCSGGNKKPLIKVDWVPEAEVRQPVQKPETILANPLTEKQDMIKWHRDKCNDIIDKIKQVKHQFSKTVGKKPSLGPVISRFTTSQFLPKKLIEAEQSKNIIRTFEDAHVKKSSNLAYKELLSLQNQVQSVPLKNVPNPEEAKEFIDTIKRRTKNANINRTFQKKMQTFVLDEVWKKILDDQEKEFDRIVCKSLLKQSQYEKQMCSKLFAVKHQKKMLIENRKFIEKLILNEREKIFSDVLNRKLDAKGENAEDEIIEKEKLRELHKRIYNEKLSFRLEQHLTESKDILYTLIDIAVSLSEYRAEHNCSVPKRMMKDMKELFFKNLPIFPEMEAESIGIQLAEEGQENEVSSTASLDQERHDILNECDFNDYLFLLGPWIVEHLKSDGTDPEGNSIVLGYLVHKLLSVKYPPPAPPKCAEIKPMKTSAVVQGLVDEKAVEMLKDLLKTKKILLVRVDDALNYVLLEYKQELSVVRDIDINFQKATKTALRGKDQLKIEKPISMKEKLSLKEDPRKGTIKTESDVKEVETQTPKRIPEEDPLLSPAAELGKIVFEALGVGDPVPDSAIVPSIIAYVSSKQSSNEGWVLLDYPTSYTQARLLEYALTGYQLMSLEENLRSREEIGGYVNRSSSFNSNGEASEKKRLSRLVPKPNPTEEYPPPKTYFNVFVRIKKTMEISRTAEESVEEDSALDNFYSKQGVLSVFEFLIFNFQSMKDLAKLILGEVTDQNHPEISDKTSLEIFGETFPELVQKWAPIKGRADSKKLAPITANFTKSDVRLDVKLEEDSPLSIKAVAQSIPKLGDSNWNWAEAPQPEELQIAMATVWEDMEAIYIEDFKQILYRLRLHHSNGPRYSAFVFKSVRTFMQRPDDKQKLLSEFQRMYNDIDQDLRCDIDIKCELHVRVSEFEAALLEIADNRKSKSEYLRVRVILDNWVSHEIANVVNNYITALQLEANRCVDSCLVINDYYASLQQKLPEEAVAPKIFIPKIQLSDRNDPVLSTTSVKTRASVYSQSAKSSRESRSKTSFEKVSKSIPVKGNSRSFDKRKRLSDDSIMASATEVVSDILISCSSSEGSSTPFHLFFLDCINKANSDISYLIGNCLSIARKEEKSGKSDLNSQIVAECLFALENELKRYLFRAKLIQFRGLLDLDEFLSEMLNTFKSLSEEIGEMYSKEMFCISECCKIFRCAIEEEKPIQPLLCFAIDRFVVRQDILLFDNPAPASDSINKQISRNRFSIEQLSRLCQKLSVVAPDGEIIKRSLVYIIEDLRVLRPEDGTELALPEIWDQMIPDDVAIFFHKVYQKLEIVNWKDFIIYAMDLPFPTENEILSMREKFRNFDLQMSELISGEDFESVEFWFDGVDERDRREEAKSLLFRMYQVDDLHTNYSALMLAFCKDADPAIGFSKALALVLGKRICLTEGDCADFSDKNPEAALAIEDLSEEVLANVTQLDVGFNIKEIKSSTEIMSEPANKTVPPSTPCQCDSTSFDERSNVGEAGESYPLLHPSRSSLKSFYVSKIPSEIVSSILLASFPSLPQLTILLNCKETFQETMQKVYESLEPVNETVHTYKLIQHKFIYQLLTSTNKFKIIDTGNVVSDIIKKRSVK